VKSKNNLLGKKINNSLDSKLAAKTLNCRELTERILKLESEVKELKEFKETVIETPGFQSELWWHDIWKKKRGRRPKISDESLIWRRDNLIDALEANWEKVHEALLDSKCDDDIRAALNPFLSSREETREALKFEGLSRLYSEKKRLRKEPTKRMLKALASKRRKLPPILDNLPSRNLANALAGVPKMTCRASLEKCAQIPSQKRPALPMWIYYSSIYDFCPKPPADKTN
jgi:hypothetical protein